MQQCYKLNTCILTSNLFIRDLCYITVTIFTNYTNSKNKEWKVDWTGCSGSGDPSICCQVCSLYTATVVSLAKFSYRDRDLIPFLPEERGNNMWQCTPFIDCFFLVSVFLNIVSLLLCLILFLISLCFVLLQRLVFIFKLYQRILLLLV